ncbi:COG5430 Uncharacterized secreted protein [Burkholderiales bacterium]
MPSMPIRSLSALLALALLTATSAQAETKTSSFDARVQVTATCSLTTADLSFPAITTGNLSNVDATSSINVTCSSGTPYQISLSDGSNFNSTRRMAWGSSYIAYDLFSDSNRSQSWSSTAIVQGNGSGSTQQIPLYGRIFSGQAVPNTGSYADTIIATISY